MLENREGLAVPDVVVHVRKEDSWIALSTAELFKGKRIVFFALPGAFTPTCSASHLPRYNELADTFKQLGIDDVICLSVNDTFVMNAWKKQQKADHITMLPDGNGAFSELMGLLVNKEAIGFGWRSWRYSMVVEDGIIEKMFIEPEKAGDPFEVSDADTMLNYLSPEIAVQESITLFTKPGCSFCSRAKQMLEDRGLKFEEIVLGRDATTVSLRAITGKTSAPQVFIGARYIGGSEDLARFLQTP